MPSSDKGIDIRTVRAEALPVPLEDGCVVTNISPANSVYYATASTVSTSSTELTYGSSVTLSTDTWFIAAANAGGTIRIDRVAEGDLDTQLSEIQSAYRTVISPRAILLPDTVSAGTYVGLPDLATATAASATGAATGVVYLNPADYAVTGKTTKYRVKADCFTNATSVDTLTVTWGFYPVSATAGGTDASTITLGTVTSGSTVAFVDQATSTRGTGNSGDFTAPAAGYYALGAVTSDAPGANSYVTTSASLQVRNV